MRKNKKIFDFEEEDFGKRLELALAIAILFLIVVFTTVKSVKLESAPINSHVSRFDTIVDVFTDVYTPEPTPPKPVAPPPVITEEQNAEDADNSAENDNVPDFISTWGGTELPPTPEPKDDSVYNYGMVQVKPRLIKKVLPEYPELARKAGIEGTVLLEIVIDTTGHVKSVKVKKSSNEIFNAAAVEAVKRFVFTPAMQNDRKVSVSLVIPIKFQLEH